MYFIEHLILIVLPILYIYTWSNVVMYGLFYTYVKLLSIFIILNMHGFHKISFQPDSNGSSWFLVLYVLISF